MNLKFFLMKRFKYPKGSYGSRLLLIVFFITLLTTVSKSNPHYFEHSNLEKGIQEAQSTGKLLIVHFSAAWCMPSKWMNEKILQDAAVQDVLVRQFITITIDVDAVDGFQAKENYQITDLPTLLVFNHQAEEVERITGIQSPKTLLNQLQKLEPIASSLSPSSSDQTIEASSAMDFSHLEKPALIPEWKKPNKAKVLKTNEKDSPNYLARPKQLFGVEIAQLSSYSSVVQYVKRLERKLPEKIYIRLHYEGDRKTYKVIIGKFVGRKKAFDLRLKLQRQAIYGVVSQL